MKSEKMELSFDIRGNLKPYELIELEQSEFVAQFVDSFEPESSRSDIYHDYERYLFDLRQILKHNFHQWVDGSFITTKRNPRDLDVVSFVAYQDYEANQELLEQKFSSKNAREIYKVDAYLVPKYEESHPKYAIYRSDSLYWRNLFGRTRVNRAKRQFEKGIIQLNFDQNG